MRRVAITGARSYTGRYLAARHLAAGDEIVSLSSRTTPIAAHNVGADDAEAGRLTTHPLSFDDEAALGSALEGVDTLYSTYWIRFATADDSHHDAAERVGGLFELARAAGVRKIVFTSHTQASEDSPFEYIAGKARAAAMLRACGVPSYGIVRPCGIFGDTANESILMNNAAWVMRRTPLFLLPGRFVNAVLRAMTCSMQHAATTSVLWAGTDGCL
jgi:nucleoside-diphosphate-sugar epimerase